MTAAFTSVKIVGGLLPSDLLGRIAAGDRNVPALDPQTYGLQPGESVRRQASRSWDYLLGIWKEFRDRPDKTGHRWLHILLRELDFRDVSKTGGLEIDGKPFPVSHLQDNVPIHLLGWRTDLDHRTPGRTARAPQSMVQDLLNRSDDYLWAILSNGSSLRLLRDSRTLVGAAYIEFDLEAMFDGDLFADFVRLYRLCHRSRFVGDPCPLEAWLGFASEAGTRALNQLRGGVEEAIGILGTGFLSHPANPQLRHRLNGSDELDIRDFNRALLRVVYRLLFWFVAEDRNVLLHPAASPVARQRYEKYFSSDRLRSLARRRHGSRHSDLAESVKVVFTGLGTESGIPELGIPGIGGIYERGALDEPLDSASITNQALLAAVRSLSVTTDPGGGGLRRVDFANLGSEELGSVYESLLELIPRYNPEDHTYSLETLAGNERKETGSYYTPSSLVECLLDSALEPLLDEASRADDPVSALLDLTVCDPACGSGHFLVAAARRIAKRVAAVRTDDPEPSDAAVRSAMREVVGRCVYGVDVNPMAAELAKVSLWMEAMEPGKPLNFLDTNIRVGNSLLDATPKLLRDGIPNEAFKVLEGDDKKVTAALKKDNKAQHAGQDDLFSISEIKVSNRDEAAAAAEIIRALPESLEDEHVQARRAMELLDSPGLRHQKLLADAWCAAFVQPKTPETRSIAITQAVLERLASGPSALSPEQLDMVNGLARDYRFFHWHVEFPHIFPTSEGPGLDPATGWSGGFSCVIGNPPWDKVKVQEKEFFGSRHAAISRAQTASLRKRMIEELATSDDALERRMHQQFNEARRHSERVSHFLHTSLRYPLTGRGEIDTYQVFAETDRDIMRGSGRLGIILKTGIATNETTQGFLADLVEKSHIVSFFDFENTKPFFKNVHSSTRFCLVTLNGRNRRLVSANFGFFLHDITDLQNREVVFELSPSELAALNPNTKTLPVFRSKKDAKIVSGIYRRTPILTNERAPDGNPWGVTFESMFHMSNDSHEFHTRRDLENSGWHLHGNVFRRNQEEMLPLYQGMMASLYDHRAADIILSKKATERQTQPSYLSDADHASPSRLALPMYWVKNDVLPGYAETWLLAYSKITGSTNGRVLVPYILPRCGAGDMSPVLMVADPERRYILASVLSSFVFDYVARQKVSGTNLNYFIVKQFPVPDPHAFNESTAISANRPLSKWLRPRVIELTYTAHDMAQFAQDLGDNGLPFRWDQGRRALIRAELDAVYFHLYGIERDDVDYIMETFSIVKRKDEEQFGEYRTKRLILEIYDAMDQAIRTRKPYRSVLDPPPGHGPRHRSGSAS